MQGMDRGVRSHHAGQHDKVHGIVEHSLPFNHFVVWLGRLDLHMQLGIYDIDHVGFDARDARL